MNHRFRKGGSQASLFFFLTSLLIALAVLPACQTTGGVSRDYKEALKSNRELENRKTTTVLILVDGLSKDILSTSLREKRVPSLRSFFSLGTESGFKFQLARAAFPSLTYPNLTSILTGLPVSNHGVIGNRILIDGDLVNFENVLSWRTLDQLVEDKTVFSRLRAKNLTSVSCSYPFPTDTTAHVEKSVDAGLHYIEERYDEIDRHSIESLDYLLTRTEAETWPGFVFLHLIGVDALSHAFGPDDTRVQDYLETLDSRLQSLFSTLESKIEESSQTYTVVLTSDHGSQKIERSIDVSSFVTRLDRTIQLVQDNRIATLTFPASYSLSAKRGFAKELLQAKDLKATILKTPDGPETFTRTDAALTGNEDLLWPAVEDYFRSPNAPDLLLLTNDGVDFSGDYLGNHGGFTSDELLVPLLMRGVRVPHETVKTSDLLKLLGLE